MSSSLVTSPPLIISLALICCGLPLAAQSDPIIGALRQAGGRDALLEAGEDWMGQERYMRAVPFYLAATRDGTGAEVIDSLTGLALHRAGVAYYFLEMDREAVTYYRRAVSVRDSIYPYPHEDRALSRSNMSNSLGYLGQLDSAVLMIREANALYEVLPVRNRLNYLRNLNQLASLASQLRDFRLAYSATYRAVSLIEQMPEADAEERFITYHNAALKMLRLDQLDEALTYARLAVTAAEKVAHPLDLATAYNVLAIVQRERGDVQDGLATLRRAESMIDPDNQLEPLFGSVYLNLAEYYGGENDERQFERYRKQAREVFASTDLRDYYISEKIPEVLLKWEQYEEAVQEVNERIAFLTDKADGGDIGKAYADQDIVPLVDLLSVRARAYAATRQRAAALADYRVIFDLQRRLRDSVSTDASRQYLSRNLRPFFDRAIALYLAEYQDSKADSCLWRAFELSEQSRAYSLLSALEARQDGITPRESRLLRTVANLERRVALGEKQRQPELEAARMQLERLRYENRVTSAESPVSDSAGLIAHLQRNKYDLLEYHLAPEGSLVFLLTRDGKLRGLPIQDADQLSGRVERFRQTIANGAYRRKSLRQAHVQDSLDRAFLAAGTELAAQLLPPAVRESLHLRPRLCIVPDGVLHYLPFAALPLAEAEVPLDYESLDYLQGAAELQFAYSGHYLTQVSQRVSTSYAHDLLAFAPSFGGGSAPTAGPRESSVHLRGANTLLALPYNREEVETVSQLVSDAVSYYGPEANRQHFLDELGSSRILHLSSHGSVNPTDPNLSFVAFAQTGDTLQQEEMLFFNDLYGLPITNELTVLSACETSLGQLAVGETTMSFASAFAAAGAKSTVTTLWQVDDRATKDLIVDFYRRLVDGDSRVAALNAAQGELRSGEYAHPFYWSGVTLYGAAGPLLLEPAGGSGVAFWWVAVLAVGILAGGLLLWRRLTGRRRRSLAR